MSCSVLSADMYVNEVVLMLGSNPNKLLIEDSELRTKTMGELFKRSKSLVCVH
jgi:hypothetical protein